MHERLSLVALEVAYLANMLAPRKDKKAWQPSDFIPEPDEVKPTRRSSSATGDAPRKPTQSVEHMKSILKGLAGALGGEIREHKPISEEASN